MTIFRPYRSSEAERSDRSASDRLRHREKLRDAIRDNIADIVAEEAIIGQGRDRVIKVPLRGIKEYRFVYGPNQPRAAQGDGDSERGQVVGKAGGQGPGGPGDRAGDRPGEEVYETEITLEELTDILFEDLELPDLERRTLREVVAERTSKRKGYRRVGIRARLDKRRTARAKIRRKVATQRVHDVAEEKRFPFHPEDLKYRHITPDLREESNAAVICIMDTSGSMDVLKKYLARSFFFLLHRFLQTKYENVEVAFVAHHTTAREVTENEFFHRGESGGTFLSSGYRKALEIVHERYHPSLWNVYAFHCSDGDNFDSDNAAAIAAAHELCAVTNLFGYGEIKPRGTRAYEDSMLETFRKLDEPNFQTVLIERKEDVWPSFQKFLSKERAEGATP